MSIADPNKTILTGENPFIRLSAKDGEPNSTEASYWRIIFSPAGPGHVLYLKSELTEGRWRIYSDNIAMARWLQSTVQGMLNAELSDTTIPCADAQFSKAGDPRYFWTEHISSHGEEISLTWFEHRRAAAHPLAAAPDSRPALRRLHRADPGARHASRPQQRRGERAILAAGTGGATILDLGVGILGKLDGSGLRRSCLEGRRAFGRRTRCSGVAFS